MTFTNSEDNQFKKMCIKISLFKEKGEGGLGKIHNIYSC
jgi:hypothetical protein